MGTTLELPAIQVDGTLTGVIAINEALNNVNTAMTNSGEINVSAFGTGGAIAVNYDGAEMGVLDTWVSGVTIVVNLVSYSANNAAAKVYQISKCLGDMNGDRLVNSSDDSDFALGRDTPATYASDYPGRAGSRDYHGNCSGHDDGDFGTNDNSAFANLKDECCEAAPTTRNEGDVNWDYAINITDLGIVLAGFGSATTIQTGDANNDGVVNISDLGIVLSQFGHVYCPVSGPFLATQAGSITLSVAARDTSGYSATGFAGEVDHFVFDAKIEVADVDDDWTTTAVSVTRANGAVFYLVSDPNDPPIPGSSKPGKFATAFSVPKAVNANSRFDDPFPTGGVLGACDPLDPDYDYTTTHVDACWYDTDTTSNDGPAAVFRVTIDVSGVTGADTSSGFGAVYFSTTGAAGAGDIKVADFELHATHTFQFGTLTTLEGEFFVMD